MTSPGTVAWADANVGVAVVPEVKGEPGPPQLSRTEDAGRTWRRFTPKLPPAVPANAWQFPDLRFATGRDGIMEIAVPAGKLDMTWVVLETRDAGLTWSMASFPGIGPTELKEGVGIDARNGVLFAGNYSRPAASAVWRRLSTPPWRSKQTHVYFPIDAAAAVGIEMTPGAFPPGQRAFLHRTTDAGASWRTVAVPLFEELRRKSDGLMRHGDWQGWATANDGWAILTERCGDGPICLSGDSDFGTLYVRHDGGATWTQSIPQR